jgi:hypothetical protein
MSINHKAAGPFEPNRHLTCLRSLDEIKEPSRCVPFGKHDFGEPGSKMGEKTKMGLTHVELTP